MSMWLHVAAVVRVDSCGFVPDDEITDIFGKPCLWDDDVDVWHHMEDFPEQYLPMGSEGSLNISIWHNPRECDMPSTTVTIFGDLRDKYDPHEIVNWFKDKCELCDKTFIVRQAVITVDAEYGETVTYTYDGPFETEDADDDEDTETEITEGVNNE